MKKYGVIVGGGSGQRMGTLLPKQFLLLHEKPVIFYTIKTFFDAFPDIEIILVLPEKYLQQGALMIAELFPGKPVILQPGGATRFHSVKNGLKLVKDHSVVFVHDAVRCLLTQELIWRCYKQAIEKGSAIPAVAATDSIRLETNGVHRVEDRNNVRIVQTPQTFLSTMLIDAFSREYEPSFTDEATVVESYGTPVHLIEGEYQNLKITRPIDLLIAEKILEDVNLFKQT